VDVAESPALTGLLIHRHCSVTILEDCRTTEEVGMSSSVTIGSVAVLALTMVAEAAPRGILGEGTRRAYSNLKAKIAEWINSDGAFLEQRLALVAWRARIAKAIEQQSPEEQANVRTLVVDLIEALKKDALRGSLGISIRRLDAIHAQLTP